MSVTTVKLTYWLLVIWVKRRTINNLLVSELTPDHYDTREVPAGIVRLQARLPFKIKVYFSLFLCDIYNMSLAVKSCWRKE